MKGLFIKYNEEPEINYKKIKIMNRNNQDDTQNRVCRQCRQPSSPKFPRFNLSKANVKLQSHVKNN
jgi:hypothetical protein